MWSYSLLLEVAEKIVKKKEGRLKKRTREELAGRREATGQVRGDGQWSERTWGDNDWLRKPLAHTHKRAFPTTLTPLVNTYFTVLLHTRGHPARTTAFHHSLNCISITWFTCREDEYNIFGTIQRLFRFSLPPYVSCQTMEWSTFQQNKMSRSFLLCLCRIRDPAVIWTRWVWDCICFSFTEYVSCHLSKTVQTFLQSRCSS